MKLNITKLLLPIFLFLLSGCYYLPGKIKTPDSSSYESSVFDYHAYAGYDDDSRQKFIDDIEKKYLSDIKKNILNEDITFPPVTLCEFVDIALAERSKDEEFFKTGLGLVIKRDAKELTRLTAELLKRTRLFQSVSIMPDSQNSDGLIVSPTIGLYEKHFSPLGPAVPVTAMLTFGVIYPVSSKEIITLNFEFSSDERIILSSKGIGGAYTHLSSAWMEDNPSIYSKMNQIAFGRAFRELILNIIDHRDDFKK